MELASMACLVCGARSTGIHYGVNSCESCKGFFRRSFTRRRSYQCKATIGKRGECQMQSHAKNCASCRYQKCQHVGMSKEGIQLGRRPGKKRNAAELSPFSDVSSHSDTNSTDMTETLTVPADLKVDLDVIRGPCLSKLPTLISDNVSSPLSPETDEFVVDMADTVIPASLPGLTCDDIESSVSEPSLPGVTRDTVPLVENEILLTTQASSVREILQEGTDLDTDPDVIIQTVISTNEKINSHEFWALKWNELEESHAEHRKELEMQKSLFGEVEPLSADDYQAIYSCTGIDVDNYVGDFKSLLRYLSAFLAGMIKFAKRIPGFKDLSLKDQASLIRGTCTEYGLLTMYRTLSYRFNILTLNTGELLTKERFSRYVSCEYSESLWEFPGKMQRLDLTIDDTAMLKAVCMTCPDRLTLEYPEQVERIHLRLVHCFQKVLKQNHPNNSKLFGKIIDRWMDMRSIAVIENKEMMAVLMRWPADLWDAYGLLYEFFSERTDL